MSKKERTQANTPNVKFDKKYIKKAIKNLKRYSFIFVHNDESVIEQIKLKFPDVKITYGIVLVKLSIEGEDEDE